MVGGVAVVALAACGSAESDQLGGDRVEPLAEAPASPATVPMAAASPLATVAGSQNTSSLDLLDACRNGNSVAVRLRLRTGDELFHPEVLSADGETADLSGARLVDPVNLREHLPLQTAAGDCVCTRLEDNPYSLADTVDLSVRFAAPSADVHEVSISVPTFAAFDGVRIG